MKRPQGGQYRNGGRALLNTLPFGKQHREEKKEMSGTIKGIILAGGAGTRLHPATLFQNNCCRYSTNLSLLSRTPLAIRDIISTPKTPSSTTLATAANGVTPIRRSAQPYGLAQAFHGEHFIGQDRSAGIGIIFYGTTFIIS